jgi:hypothetical protein
MTDKISSIQKSGIGCQKGFHLFQISLPDGFVNLGRGERYD